MPYPPSFAVILQCHTVWLTILLRLTVILLAALWYIATLEDFHRHVMILLAGSTSRWLASLSLSGSRDAKITDEFGSI